MEFDMNTVTREKQQISAIHEILKWSIDRPEWQRDALRRIVIKGFIDETDIGELHQLCCSKHNPEMINSTPLKVSPLDKSHIPSEPDSQASVTLVSIGELQGVNRLPPEQSIPFGPALGLTIIYGDNGTGKSGYARVIKKACRTRGVSPEILSDAFAPSSSTSPSGTIICRDGAKEMPPIQWKDGSPSDPLLANVFVFDALTANHYLESDGPATFTPSGLDVLPKLSKTCDAINRIIKDDIDRMKAVIQATAKNWKLHSNTAVGKLIAELSANTELIQVDSLCGLDEKEGQRLKDIADALRSDPKQKAKETRASAERIRVFASKIREVFSFISGTQMPSLRKLIEDVESTNKVAKAFTANRFDPSYLSGTGEDVWQKLWEAARSFSVSSAYKDQSFPVTTDGARCVLCQQSLDPEATARLKTFEAFCKDKSQELANEAATWLKNMAQKIEKLTPLTPEYDKIETDFLASGSPDQKDSIKTFVKTMDECLAATKDNLSKVVWKDPVQVLSSPEETLIAIVSYLEARAKTEESAEDPEIRKKLEVERDELNDREWLARTKSDILSQIERYKRIDLLERCFKDTQTQQITLKNSELTKLIVTEAFCNRFKDEADDLGLRTIKVRLEEIKGKKGETRFGLRLETGAGFQVKDIASEGEKRCIALAAFLAELSQASHQSALVFDDPVSSLDHHYRDKTAARLAEESKVRQVIVFTHDVVFLNDLESCAKKVGVSIHISHLEWNGNIPGQCIEGLPWDCKSTDDRLDKLDKEQKIIAGTWSTLPNEENIQAIRGAYGRLRATLERLVERDVFADVIFRFRSFVNLKNLRGAVGFSTIECDEILRLHKRCCDVTDAHDPSGKQAAVPNPTDLSRDIQSTKDILKAIRTRKKSVAGTASSNG